MTILLKIRNGARLAIASLLLLLNVAVAQAQTCSFAVTSPILQFDQSLWMQVNYNLTVSGGSGSVDVYPSIAPPSGSSMSFATKSSCTNCTSSSYLMFAASGLTYDTPYYVTLRITPPGQSYPSTTCTSSTNSFIIRPQQRATAVSWSIGGQANATAVTVVANTALPVAVTFSNTGSSTWKAASSVSQSTGHKVGLVVGYGQTAMGSTAYGASRFLISPYSTPPGSSASASGSLLFPSAGTYQIQLQMLEEGNVWFNTPAPSYSGTITVTVLPGQPTAATAISASDGSYADKVRVTWVPGTNITTQRVIRAPQGTALPAGPYTGVPAGWSIVCDSLAAATTSCDDASASTGTKYTYGVFSWNSANPGSYGGWDTGVMSALDTGFKGLAATAATNISATDGTLVDRIRVTWTPGANVTTQRVLRAPQGTAMPAGPYSSVPSGWTVVCDNLTAATTTCDDTSAATGTTYIYATFGFNNTLITAVSGWDTGAMSTTDSGYRGVSTLICTMGSQPIVVSSSTQIIVPWFTVSGTTPSIQGTYTITAPGSQPGSGLFSGSSGTSAMGLSIPTPHTYGTGTVTISVLDPSNGNTPVACTPTPKTYTIEAPQSAAPQSFSIAGVANPSAVTIIQSLPTMVSATFQNTGQSTWQAATTATDSNKHKVGLIQNGTQTVQGTSTRLLLGQPTTAPGGQASANGYLVSTAVGQQTWSLEMLEESMEWFATAMPQVTVTALPMLSAPYNVTASTGLYADHVHIFWSLGSNMTNHRVIRALKGAAIPAGPYTGIPAGWTVVCDNLSAAATSCDDTSAAQGQQYSYAVFAWNANANSAFSTWDIGVFSGAAIGYLGAATLPATNLTATKGTQLGSVTVSWTPAASGLAQYVMRASATATWPSGTLTGQPAGWTTIGGTTVAMATSSMTDSGQVAGTTYQYRVFTLSSALSSLNGGWDTGAVSNSDTGWGNFAPTAIAGSIATLSVRSGATQLTLTDPNTAQGDTVMYSLASALDAAGAGSCSISGSTLTWTPPAAGSFTGSTSCSVTATDLAGLTVTNPITVTVTAPPSATNVKATDGTYTNKVAITWTVGAGTAGQRVLRAAPGTPVPPLPYVSAPAGWTVVCDSLAATATTCDDTTAAPGTTYSYSVFDWTSAVSSANSGWDAGAMSALDTGYAAFTTAPATNLQASDGTSAAMVVVQWTPGVHGTTQTLLRAVPGAIWPSTVLSSMPTGWTPVTACSNLPITATSCNDTNQVAGVSVQYRVFTIDTSIASANGGWDTGAVSNSDTGWGNFAPTAIAGSITTDAYSVGTAQLVVTDPNSNQGDTATYRVRGALDAAGQGTCAIVNGALTWTPPVSNAFSGATTCPVAVTDKAGQSVNADIPVQVACGVAPSVVAYGLDAHSANVLSLLVQMPACAGAGSSDPSTWISGTVGLQGSAGQPALTWGPLQYASDVGLLPAVSSTTTLPPNTVLAVYRASFTGDLASGTYAGPIAVKNTIDGLTGSRAGTLVVDWTNNADIAFGNSAGAVKAGTPASTSTFSMGTINVAINNNASAIQPLKQAPTLSSVGANEHLTAKVDRAVAAAGIVRIDGSVVDITTIGSTDAGGDSGGNLAVIVSSAGQFYSIPARRRFADSGLLTAGQGSTTESQSARFTATFSTIADISVLPAGTYQPVAIDGQFFGRTITAALTGASFTVDASNFGSLALTDSTGLNVPISTAGTGATRTLANYPPLRDGSYTLTVTSGRPDGSVQTSAIAIAYARKTVDVIVSTPLVDNFPAVVQNVGLANPLTGAPFAGALTGRAWIVSGPGTSGSINGVSVAVGAEGQVTLPYDPAMHRYAINSGANDSMNVGLWIDLPDAPTLMIKNAKWAIDNAIALSTNSADNSFAIKVQPVTVSAVVRSGFNYCIARPMVVKTVGAQSFNNVDASNPLCAIRWISLPDALAQSGSVFASLTGMLKELGAQDIVYQNGVLFRDPTTGITSFYTGPNSTVTLTGTTPKPIAIDFVPIQTLKAVKTAANNTDPLQYYVPIGVNQQAGSVNSTSPYDGTGLHISTQWDGEAVKVTDSRLRGIQLVTFASIPAVDQHRTLTVNVAYGNALDVSFSKVFDFTGIPNTLQLNLDRIANAESTRPITISGKFGRVTSAGTNFDETTYGKWEISLKTVARGGVAAVSLGEPTQIIGADGTFSIDVGSLPPNGALEIAPTATLVSDNNGYESVIHGNSLWLTIKDGSALTATVTATQAAGAVDFAPTLMATVAPIRAGDLGSIRWETNDGTGWQPAVDSTGTSPTSMVWRPVLTESGKRLYRATLTNRWSGLTAVTNAVELTAFNMAKLSISGPNAGLVGFPVALNVVVTKADPQTLDINWVVSKGAGDKAPVSGSGQAIAFTPATAGNYTVTVTARDKIAPAGNGAAATLAYAFTVALPVLRTPSIVGEAGPETGKAYTYTAAVMPLFASTARSDYQVRGKWILPDGTEQPEGPLTLTLTTAGPQTLKYVAWIEGIPGFQPVVGSRVLNAWTYHWPVWTLGVQQLNTDAPANVRLQILTDATSFAALHGEKITYSWAIPPEATITSINGQYAYISLPQGSWLISGTASDTRGNSSTVRSQSLQVAAASGLNFDVVLSSSSDKYMRAPLTVGLTIKVSSLPRSDSFASATVSLDGTLVGTINSVFGSLLVPTAGEHVVKVTVTTRGGVSSTVETPVTVVEGDDPQCALTTSGGGAQTTTIVSKCTLQIGYIASYSWVAQTSKGTIKIGGASSLAISALDMQSISSIQFSAFTDKGKSTTMTWTKP